MLKPLHFLISGLAFLLLMCLLIPVNTGCKTKTVYDTTYIHDTITINKNSIFLCWLYGAWQEGQGILISDPIADTALSHLKIEWGDTSSLFLYKFIYPGYIGFYDELYLSASTNYKLTLTSNIGSSQGTIKMPDSTTITQPYDWQVIPLGQNITCMWTDAGSSCYEVYYYIDGYDSYGYWVGGIYKDIFVSTNSLTLPAGLFNIAGAVRYDVDFYVDPFAGPLPSPGASGNMTGTIKGFLIAYGEGDDVYFYVGSSPLKTEQKHDKKQPSRQDHMNAYLKQLGVEQVIK